VVALGEFSAYTPSSVSFLRDRDLMFVCASRGSLFKVS
jgi:hypothetical protein